MATDVDDDDDEGEDASSTTCDKGDNHSCDKSNGDGDGDRECRALPSRDLVATALVLAAEAAAALIADDADGGNSGVAIIGSASHATGGGVIN